MGKKKKSKNLIFFSKILKIANNLRIQKKISKKPGYRYCYSQKKRLVLKKIAILLFLFRILLIFF